MRTFLLILFMAYNCPENLFTTRKTLPKEPLSMTLITLKSLSLLFGSPSLEIRHCELELSICSSSLINFSFLLYLSSLGLVSMTKSLRKSSFSDKSIALRCFGLPRFPCSGYVVCTVPEVVCLILAFSSSSSYSSRMAMALNSFGSISKLLRVSVYLKVGSVGLMSCSHMRNLIVGTLLMPRIRSLSVVM
jgi:hypothetical protein